MRLAHEPRPFRARPHDRGHGQGVLCSRPGPDCPAAGVPGLFGDAGPAPDNRDHVERWLFDDGGSLTYYWLAHSYSIVLPTGLVDIKVVGDRYG